VRSNLNGLSQHEAAERKKSGETNSFEPSKKQSVIKKFLSQFKDLMVIILIISAVLSITISITSGEYQNLFEGGIIVFIVLLNATMGVVQESKAENALESLKKQTEPFANVLRDGIYQSVKIEDIVVGDIVMLSSGNIVPADLRLLESYNLKTNESALTGESGQVEKNADLVLNEKSPLGERKNMAYRGSSVVCGRGVGVVVGVGKNTEMGKIASMITTGKKEQTPLQKSLSKIGKIISISVIIIAIIIFIVEMTLPKSPKLLEAFLTAVALAVAAIPESMPASITIIMALGVQRLAKHGAIIKRLHAVETLGSCNVICSDKTGTLTQNKMTVKSVFYENDAISIASDADNINTHFKQMINCMVLCNDAKKAETKFLGEPTETALIAYAEQCGYNVNEIIFQNKRIAEIPFDSSRKCMTTVNQSKNGIMCFCKGAFDFLLKKCSKYIHNGKVENISQQFIDLIEKQNKKMTKKSMRVLAFACKQISEKTDDNNFKKTGLELSDKIECDLVFLGLVGMVDPPRPEVFAAVKKCKTAGLKPVMITGDHAETALAIAIELGIATKENQVLTGAEIDLLSDEKLASKIFKYSVFARVSPEHKVRIVKAFRACGKIVAMTGDGVNDAPSLKIADIGIGMGISGTDVTKEVADMIISDDNFSSIVVAVEEGRKIYSNIQRTIQFLLSTNAVEVFTLFLTSLFLPQFTFLLPSQLLFINFITDTLPAISLGLEDSEKDIMTKPPRDSKTNIISIDVWAKILYQAGIQIIIVMSIYVLGINMFSPQVASTMAFYCINIMQLLHAVNLKTNHSIFAINIFKNKVF
ncbi:MAG: cation-translocating P-type ATPase, partial [Clostridia bacterium]|nr:cation-translocating P-type ATPase [Clostridia bacterium]